MGFSSGKSFVKEKTEEFQSLIDHKISIFWDFITIY
ncbi:MAG: hypothetical protein ACJAVF_004904, partial [Paraglaciecola sp.]